MRGFLTRHLTSILPGLMAACVAAAGLPGTAAAQANAYPDREIRLVMPFPPGGPTDNLGRQIAQHLGEGLGRTVVVENKPGAGGSLAGGLAAQADPDGYTLMFGNSAVLAVAPALYPKLSYDPLKSFSAISSISTGYMVIVVNKDVPARNLRELIALAKAQPGKLNYGSAGNGSPLHIGGEMLKALAQVDIAHVPYKGGGPALNGLLAGEVQVGIDLLPTLLPHLRTGAIRALAVAGPHRLPALPEVPTAAEAGLSGLEMNLFTSLVAPAGIPRPIAERINAEMQKVLARKDLQEQMAKQSFTLVEKNTLAQADAFLREQVAQWAHYTKVSKARID